jgi:hypothetical protein
MPSQASLAGDGKRSEQRKKKEKKKMGLWDGIEDAELFERGVYLKGGFIGTVEIERTLVKHTRSSGDAFIVEMRVIKSNMDEHPVGQKVSWFQKLQDKDVALPAIKEWAAACAGYQVTQKEEIKTEVDPVLKEMMEIATDNPDDNDFTGIRLHVETNQILTKNNREFTRHNWAPLAA